MDVAKLRFSKEHEWVAAEDGSDLVRIGITDFAAGELGDIVFIELPETGREVKNTEAIGTIEAVKTVADLFSPLTGVVRGVNTRLEDNPELVNQSPYEEGWFLELEMANRSELDGLMSKEEYDKMVGKD